MTSLTALAAGALLLPVLTLGATQLPPNAPDPTSTAALSGTTTGPSATAATDRLPGPDQNPDRESPSRADPQTTDARSRTKIYRPGPTPIGRWAWPVAPHPRVMRGFAIGPAPWSPGHRGIDVVTAGATATAIHAPANGVVRFVGVIAGRPVLSIDHGAGLISSFEPIVSSLRRGQPVQRNDVIGRLTSIQSHCGTVPCLHWGVRKDGRYINPVLLVPGLHGPAVLLPMMSP
jgi:murein DD-endopeptidase MepM/ murein hydrolase activator NlpD